MSTVTSRPRRRKGDDVENPPTISELKNGTAPPLGLARRVELGKPICFPPDLIEQKPSAAGFQTFAFLDRECERFSVIHGQPVLGVFCSTETIGKGIDLAESTVRTAGLDWLEDRHWIVRQTVLVNGRSATMVWCMWRFPSPFAGAIPLGCGIKLKVEDDGSHPFIVDRPAPSPRVRRKPVAPPPFAPEAPISAQESAPEGSKELNLDQGNQANVSAALPGGEQKATEAMTVATIEPPPAPPADPAPPPRVPRPPAECLAALATIPVRYPTLAEPHLWDLRDQGHPLPEPWSRFKLRPRPEPEVPAPVKAAAPPAPPSTEDRLRRLIEPTGPEEAAAKVKALADLLAIELRDPTWRNGYAKWLAQAAAGERQIKHVIQAYRIARKADSPTKGKLFKYWLDKLAKVPDRGA